jgi:hypothetical protein
MCALILAACGGGGAQTGPRYANMTRGEAQQGAQNAGRDVIDQFLFETGGGAKPFQQPGAELHLQIIELRKADRASGEPAWEAVMQPYAVQEDGSQYTDPSFFICLDIWKPAPGADISRSEVDYDCTPPSS